MSKKTVIVLDREFHSGFDNSLAWDGVTATLELQGVRRIATLTFIHAVDLHVATDLEMRPGFGGKGELVEHPQSKWLLNSRGNDADRKDGPRFRKRHFDIFIEGWGRVQCIADGYQLEYEEPDE